MASLSTCHLGLWLGWQILLNLVKSSSDVAVDDQQYIYKHVGHSEQVKPGTYQRHLPVLALAQVGAALASIDRPPKAMATRKTTRLSPLQIEES